MSKMYGAVESEEKEEVVKSVDKNGEAAASDITWRPVAGSVLCLFVSGLTASFLESRRCLVTE